MKIITGSKRLDADGNWHDGPQEELEVDETFFSELAKAMQKTPETKTIYAAPGSFEMFKLYFDD